MRACRFIPLLLAAFLIAAPAAAYTIYFQDGTQIIAREKYRIADGQAIILLPNGTRVSYDANQIDVPRTEAANKTDLGGAVLLETGSEAPVVKKPAPEKKKTLSDLITNRGAGIRTLPESRRNNARRAPSASSTPTTPAGFPDLATLAHLPLGDVALTTELRQYFLSQSIEDVAINEGIEPATPILAVTANSEASVFRAIAVSASALLELQERHGSKLSALDLVITNSANQRAGQFHLTPLIAEELISRQVDIQTFYVAYVQF